ncbi:MAG: flagellar biosynthesis protein FlhB [Defluviitaleaceae bacterium]|nr:flagellar biosynthesis protein FlhB [Defluviitaleaceae bacterium]
MTKYKHKLAKRTEFGLCYAPKSANIIPMNLSFFAEGNDQDKDSKTEQPTPKKLEKAREEGQVAKSQEVSTALSLLAMFFALRLFGGWILGNTINLMHFNFGIIPDANDAMAALMASGYIAFLFQRVVLIVAPMLIVCFLVGIISSLVQVGWKPTAKPMMPKLSKMNPIQGFKRIFSMQSIVNLAKSLAKFAVVGAVVYVMVSDRISMVPAMLSMNILNSAGFIVNLLIDMGLAVGALFILIALLDYGYTRYSHIKKLRMTKQEVKDEYKQMEGDPHIKSKIRQKMREVSMRRMMQNVPEADVVITNPTHYAVALRYDNSRDKAPVLVAKGLDFAAKRIREKASEHHITIIENPTVAREIYAKVEIGEEIPYELWESVVEILAYVFKLRQRAA